MFDDAGPPGFTTALNLAATQVSHEADQNRSHSDMTWAAQFNADQSEMAYQRQLALRSTAYQASKADMEAAGFNPILMFNRGATATPSSQAAGIGASTAYGGGPQAENVAATFMANAEIRNINAQAEKTLAEKKEIEARTPTYAVSIDKLRQDMKQSEAAIQQLLATTAREYASAGQAAAQADQLRAQLPMLEETVKNIRALTVLHGAQADLAFKQSNLSQAEWEKLQQQLRQDLPQLQAQLDKLKIQVEQGNVPQAQAKGGVYGAAGGMQGNLLEFLRALKNSISPMMAGQ